MAQAYNNLGFALNNSNLISEATQCYKKAYEIDPNYSEAYSNLGNAYCINKKYGEAIKYFRKAIKMDKKNSTAYDNLEHTIDSLRDEEELRRTILFLETVVDEDPHNELAKQKV